MIVEGSQPEGDNELLDFVDDLPSIRLEDAPSSAWSAALDFFGDRPFRISGTIEDGSQSAYIFTATSDE